MNQPRLMRIGLIATLALALVLSGCGGSKKGNNGYGLAPHTQTSRALVN